MVLMLPQHVKLGLMKQFVRVLDNKSAAFKYLQDFFPKLFEAKVKAGIFDRPQIKKIMECNEFPKKLTCKVKAAWNSFVAVVRGFLGNHKTENYVELVETGGQSCQFSDTFDPCSCRNHKPFPYMSDRCPDCNYLSNDRSDLYDLDHDTWYGTEFNMTTRYVSPYGCGTGTPIWMNGNIPTIGEGVVNRTACVATFESLCASSYSIKVKRCDSSNIVYCLENLPSSFQQRYCFDFDPSTFTTTTSTTTAAKLPTTRPPITDGEHIPIANDTGVQSWVKAVLAAQSVIIVGLVAIIIVIFRQFRKNHKHYRTFPEHNMPPHYKQAIDFSRLGNKKDVTTVDNVKPRY